MTGFSFIGLINVLASNPTEKINYWPSTILSISIVFYYITIYCQNAFWGFELDLNNSRMSYLRTNDKKILQKSYFIFLSGSILLSLLNFKILVCQILGHLLWPLYALPNRGGKYKPLFGTAIHFISQPIQYFMGHFIIKESITFSDFFISIGFSLLFSFGHLQHEILDFEADKGSQIKNFATKYGKKSGYYLSSIFLLLAIVTFSISKSPLGFIFVLATIIHITIHIVGREYFIIKTIIYQKSYRLIYIIAGFVVMLAQNKFLNGG